MMATECSKWAESRPSAVTTVHPSSRTRVSWVPALIIGFVAGIGCYFMVTKVKALFGYDDSLDAFGVHGAGGTIGAGRRGFRWLRFRGRTVQLKRARRRRHSMRRYNPSWLQSLGRGLIPFRAVL